MAGKQTYHLQCKVCDKRAKVTIDETAAHVKKARSLADELNNGWIALHLCSKQCAKEYRKKS